MRPRTTLVSLFGTGALLLGRTAPAKAALPMHEDVRGTEATSVELRGPDGTRTVAWQDLSMLPRPPGAHTLAFDVPEGATAIRVPVCAGRGTVRVDGVVRPMAGRGPAVLPLSSNAAHRVTLDVKVSAYERRVACGEAPRFGAAVPREDGLTTLRFPSPYAAKGGGKAVVYLPAVSLPAVSLPSTKVPPSGVPVLVGLHPWNGDEWTYAAYRELLDEAAKQGVALLFPSGLGNSLYTEDAEDEALRALEALAALLQIDRRAVSLWGASMGGAGATTIGFHRPDRFASVTSLFGDSKYDLRTYVRSVLPDEAAAHRVNALDVVDNARHVPVWLVHGDADRVSPLIQSTELADALRKLGFDVRLDVAAGRGHEGTLVAENARAIVRRARDARVPSPVTRVSYRSVRGVDEGAYGVRITRSSPHGDAFVDLERVGDVVHVHHAEGVRAIALTRGAFGAARALPIVHDDASSRHVVVQWESR